MTVVTTEIKIRDIGKFLSTITLIRSPYAIENWAVVPK